MLIPIRLLAAAAGILLALALAVTLLASVLLRWRRRQRERDSRAYDPDTDDPELLRTQIERLQPCLLRVALDGVDELRQDWRESERAELRAGIEALLEEWAAACEGLFLKQGDSRYQLLVQLPMLRRMEEEKFPILDRVRAYQLRGRQVGVTLSIGAGQGSTYAQCGANSRQALELALGRGGDQAAVKNQDNSYQFYGGVSKRVEKTEKVKVRLMATAFAEAMRGCEQVYAMGHKRADFDTLGAAAGVCAMAKAHGKPAYIVVECDGCMAGPLLEQWRGQEGAPSVISPRKALHGLSAKTLLVLVDFHVPQLAECPQLLERAGLLAVIDHHRQAVNHVRGAQVFFLDPGVSSACEMTAELLRYTVPAPALAPAQADAMLAGIALDTRNFVLRTGASTFEAAAFLRAKGADPVRVKRLFAGEQAEMRRRMEIVTRAKVVGRCAVSIALPGENGQGDLRLLCSQAADELLNLGDVDAAFVLHADGENIHISARSLGARNVQRMMEQMGGGGHQTMAATQLPMAQYSMEDAVRMLGEAME
jgi:c-di-AMP phosphodiesterase-like protein